MNRYHYNKQMPMALRWRMVLIIPLATLSLLSTKIADSAETSSTSAKQARKLWNTYCGYSGKDQQELKTKDYIEFEKTGKAGVQIIREELKKSSATHREQAVYMLQHFMSTDKRLRIEGLKLVYPYVSDADKKVSRAVAVVLSRFCDKNLPRSVEIQLRKIISTDARPESDLSEQCIRVLTKLPYKRTKEFLIKQLHTRKSGQFYHYPGPGGCLLYPSNLSLIVEVIATQKNKESQAALNRFINFRLQQIALGKMNEFNSIKPFILELKNSEHILMLINCMRIEKFKGYYSPVFQTLKQLTGKDFGDNLTLWRRWEKGHKSNLIKKLSAKK